MGQKLVDSFSLRHRGLIPQILQKLLKARKSTRKKILYKTVKDNKGNEFSGLYDEKDVEGDC